MPERRYPRTARVNRLLQEVLADELERVAEDDDRLRLVTITAVVVDPDLRHAKVLFDPGLEPGVTNEVAEALTEQRVRLQAAVAKQVRLKRTPQLSFLSDSGVTTGTRVEEILREIHKGDAANE
ncbi:MAG: 30S ribosome-binding factor RbfA [Actinobacteria bacterium]|nr:30S ribosome-binding factor RbfA [Actinomycetota bacterium]MBV8958360.1 30S ribosome-binding factor RbfA [Actinomycetota bacterium]MBV9664228.1 30S ribosome-binding factor RbfA [Actinomycetota bacterium]MBV9936803.1 30S ribosome-binding factor RbfA [Actinomycetota bacterium]